MGQNFCHQEKHIYFEYEIDCLLNIATIKYKISFLVIYKFNGDTMKYIPIPNHIPKVNE